MLGVGGGRGVCVAVDVVVGQDAVFDVSHVVLRFCCIYVAYDNDNASYDAFENVC